MDGMVILDLIAGNFGTNSQLESYQTKPYPIVLRPDFDEKLVPFDSILDAISGDKSLSLPKSRRTALDQTGFYGSSHRLAAYSKGDD